MCERITGGAVKRADMMNGFYLALNAADSLNQMNHGMVEDEDGSNSWIDAGRNLDDQDKYIIDYGHTS